MKDKEELEEFEDDQDEECEKSDDELFQYDYRFKKQKEIYFRKPYYLI